EDLSRILSIQETRTLSKNLMFSYKNVVYQIQRETPSYMMRGAKVFVLEDKRGQIRVEYKWRLLEYRTYHEQEKAAPIACSKQINIMVDRQVRKLFKPSATHPWRKWKFNHNITLEQQV
ncbi:MAG: hypothetical protein HY559_00500, partial [Gammaproteobacteria bacterium]|nr:hypothetical protein [Gammaproteobacteria bacterium]